MQQKSFVCSISCWGCIGSVPYTDTGPVSEHLTLLTPPPFLHALSCGHYLASIGVRRHTQSLGSLGNLIRCQKKKKVGIITVLSCLSSVVRRKLRVVKVLSWPQAEGLMQSSRLQFFPKITSTLLLRLCLCCTPSWTCTIQQLFVYSLSCIILSQPIWEHQRPKVWPFIPHPPKSLCNL